MPNSEVAAAKIINYTAVTNRRVDLTFTASYDDAAWETVKARIAQRLPIFRRFTRTPPPSLPSTGMATAPSNTWLRVWTSAADYWTCNFGIVENADALLRPVSPHSSGTRNVHLTRCAAPSGT